MDVPTLFILVPVICSVTSPLVIDVNSFSGQVVAVEVLISVTLINVVVFLPLTQPPEQLVTVSAVVVSLLIIAILVILEVTLAPTLALLQLAVEVNVTICLAVVKKVVSSEILVGEVNVELEETNVM